MGFDRSKFVGASRTAQKEIISATERRDKALRPPSTRGAWHRMEEGRNVFRVAPPHDPEFPAFMPYKTVTLDCEKPIYEDGEDTGKTEVGKRKLIVATQHHDKLMKLGVMGDAVEFYVSMVKDIAYTQITDKKDRSKFLAPVTGYRGRDGVWVWGIEPKTNYIGYVFDENKTLGKLEIYPGIHKDIDRLADELEADAPLEIDPFSNPCEGYPLVITRTRNDSGKTEYIVDKEVPSRLKKESWDDFFERTKLTDAQLEELYNMEPIAKTYVNSFTMRDFESQIDGLTRFDKAHGFGIIETAEFQEVVENIEKVLQEDVKDTPEDNVKETKKTGKKPSTQKEVKKVVKKEPKKVLQKTGPTQEEMSGEVSHYISEVYGEEYSPQTPTDLKELEVWYKMVKSEEKDGDLPLVPEEEFETPVEDEVAEEVTEETTDEIIEGESTVDVDALRKQMEALRASRR